MKTIFFQQIKNLLFSKNSQYYNWQYYFIVYLIFFLLIILLAYLEVIPVKVKRIPHYDTIGHFFLMGLLAYLGHRALKRRSARILLFVIPLAPFIVTVFSIIEESFQLLTSHRTFNWIDMAANLCGIWFFYWIDRLSTRS